MADGFLGPRLLHMKQLAMTIDPDLDEPVLYGVNEEGRVYRYDFEDQWWVPLSMREKP